MERGECSARELKVSLEHAEDDVCNRIAGLDGSFEAAFVLREPSR